MEEDVFDVVVEVASSVAWKVEGGPCAAAPD